MSNLEQKLSGLYEIMEFLPPPFFDYQIKLDKIVNGKIVSDKDTPIPLQTMSSGEKQFLYAVSTLIYHIKNLRSIQQPHRVKYRKINLVLDEVELCFHPEMQRLFINKLIDTIKRLRLNIGCTFNIILSTHSPFILSNIPNCNIMYLEEGKQVNGKISINPFGANINDILKQSFFLDNGFMGAYAQKRINSLLDYLTEKKNKLEWTEKSAQDFIRLIGDEIIRQQLQNLYNEKFNIKDKKDKEIERLKEQIKKLEERK